MAEEDARAVILRRRAAFVGAALATMGCGAPSRSGSPEPAPPPSLTATGVGERAVEPEPVVDDAAPPPVPPSAPPAPPVVVQVCLSIVVPPRITFEAGHLEPRDLVTLKEAAAILRDHPRIRRLAVEGHRNASEPPGVSRARAARVEQLMIAEGVDPDRLCLVDEGDRKPVADPSTADGRAHNRRVTFTILEDDDSCDDPGATR